MIDHDTWKISQDDYDYLFGFGSIINTDTHAHWMPNNSSPACLPGQRANLRASFGYRRGWNFRSNTGFTALGITKVADNENSQGTVINGVLFRIPRSMVPAFDRREVGYDRIEVKLKHLDLLQGPDIAGGGLEFWHANILDGARIWVYVPQASFRHESNEDHPILQSYVDTVMQGCLQWGGQNMAEEFVATTFCWSPYFLNDTPSSRRPWLFRKEYNTIDAILSKHPATHFVDRRHPEEFASAFLIKMMRGTWSVPRRNPAFTGRDSELSQVHARLIAQKSAQNFQTGVAKVEIAGMGGVGKTQLCAEYCYRNFPSYYGLIIWLNAQGAESIAACYRQLMVDTTGIDVRDKDADEVISEVKARLFRSKAPWLLVFDNLEDRSLLEKFAPHGSTCGHVLVTTRSLLTDLQDPSLMVLGCFNPSESVEMLCRSANIYGDTNLSAASQLASELGHLPLALSMAAAYMVRCDVDCSEYLARYVKSDGNRTLLGHQAVESSLTLSLSAIKTENKFAWEILRLLCWLGPDEISKTLLLTLLRAKHANSVDIHLLELKASEESKSPARVSSLDSLMTISQAAMVGGLALLTNVLLEKYAKASGQFVGVRIACNSLIAGCMATAYLLSRQAISQPSTELSGLNKLQSSALVYSTQSSLDEFEQTDLIWKILKSFSLLVVKDSRGSIHRLLAQGLRNSQTDAESRLNLRISINAVKEMWKFKPEQIETWQESIFILEHLKAVVANSLRHQEGLELDTAILSREAGVFSAMVLNRFGEAKNSLDLSLQILNKIIDQSPANLRARAATLHELGRVFRYLGDFKQCEEALNAALVLWNDLIKSGWDERYGAAATFYELGVLEVKKHNLDSAAKFLEQTLDLRRILDLGSSGSEIEADYAATLHQLAAIHLARKPPSLVKAEKLLQEALGLKMQIGQRAATLKQLARVAIRRGDLDCADRSLSQALDLYVELYGEAALHVNVVAVKFQQGALAFQSDQLEQAWKFYSECLSARQHIYSYVKGNHIEVSSVLHELGRVAFAQRNIGKAQEMFQEEKKVLEQTFESSSHHQRLLQARLTNLTWLFKCAKEIGDDKTARTLCTERNSLKQHERKGQKIDFKQCLQLRTGELQLEVLECRSVTRQLALSSGDITDADKATLLLVMDCLGHQIQISPLSAIKTAVIQFHIHIVASLKQSSDASKINMLNACDALRDSLRECGVQVNDCAQNKAIS